MLFVRFADNFIGFIYDSQAPGPRKRLSKVPIVGNLELGNNQAKDKTGNAAHVDKRIKIARK